MDQGRLEKLIIYLTSLPSETDTVEFKENNSKPDDIGK
jgi:hypothetical protein